MNLGIGGDGVQHFLCAGNIDIPKCIQFLNIHWRSDNINHNMLLGVATGIIELASTLLKKNDKMKIVTTGISYH